MEVSTTFYIFADTGNGILGTADFSRYGIKHLPKINIKKSDFQDKY